MPAASPGTRCWRRAPSSTSSSSAVGDCGGRPHPDASRAPRDGQASPHPPSTTRRAASPRDVTSHACGLWLTPAAGDSAWPSDWRRHQHAERGGRTVPALAVVVAAPAVGLVVGVHPTVVVVARIYLSEANAAGHSRWCQAPGRRAIAQRSEILAPAVGAPLGRHTTGMEGSPAHLGEAVSAGDSAWSEAEDRVSVAELALSTIP